MGLMPAFSKVSMAWTWGCFVSSRGGRVGDRAADEVSEDTCDSGVGPERSRFARRLGLQLLA
jgi:hypothetical protein